MVKNRKDSMLNFVYWRLRWLYEAWTRRREVYVEYRTLRRIRVGRDG